MSKECYKCKKTLPLKDFYKDSRSKDGRSYLCVLCARAKNHNWRNEKGGKDIVRKYSAVYRKKYPEKVKLANKEYRTKQRMLVLKFYSNGDPKCVCCGEDTYEFLTIDHIDNDGAKHRQEIGATSSQLIRWLIKNNYPDGFQILCYNCNCSKGFYGKCPHEKQAGLPANRK